MHKCSEHTLNRRVLTVIPDYSPSAIINVLTPLGALNEQGAIVLKTKLENEVTPVDLLWADVLVLCRNAEPLYRPVYELALQLSLPIIYDLDDDLQAVPPTSPSAPYYNHPDRKAHQAWLMQIAAHVHVHSRVLLQTVARNHNESVSLGSAAVDWSLVPSELPSLTGSPLAVVYAANIDTARQMLPLIEADLVEVLAERGHQMHLHLYGYATPYLRRHPGVTVHPIESDYGRFFSAFTRAGYAIGLAPMLEDQFHQSKTNIKFRDYAAAGAAGIYTDCALYRDTVVDGQTGLLVPTEAGAWANAIRRLLDSPGLLQLIRQRARQAGLAEYNLDTVTAQWLHIFRSLSAKPELAEDERRTVEAMRWWFTGLRTTKSPAVNLLRGWLRKRLPARWKVLYHDAQASLYAQVHRISSGKLPRP